MYRYSLRTFLVVCAVSSILLAVIIQWRWQPQASFVTLREITRNGIQYDVTWMSESGPYRGQRLLNAVIVPEWSETPTRITAAPRRSEPDGQGLEAYPTGVFYEGNLIGGHGTSRVVIALSKTDVRVIELSLSEIKELDAITDIGKSSIWKNKVEPEIDRLVALRNQLPEYRKAFPGRKPIASPP